MKFPFRPALLREMKSYVNHGNQTGPETIDLSRGVNPFGCSPAVREAFRNLKTDGISDYPHSGVLREAICRYWAADAPIREEKDLSVVLERLSALDRG